MKNLTQKIILTISLTAVMLLPTFAFAKEKNKEPKPVQAQIVPLLFEKIQANNNWKTAFITGKNAQIVFMNISPETNPSNESGLITSPFDQIILVAQGNGKAILNGKGSMIKSGDLIYIAQGVSHNLVNLNSQGPLKIISITTSPSMPINSTYKTKANEPKS